jgi:hypothetical protein
VTAEQAYRLGQERMRERAVGVARILAVLAGEEKGATGRGRADAALAVERAIRALAAEPQEA